MLTLSARRNLSVKAFSLPLTLLKCLLQLHLHLRKLLSKLRTLRTLHCVLFPKLRKHPKILRTLQFVLLHKLHKHRFVLLTLHVLGSVIGHDENRSGLMSWWRVRTEEERRDAVRSGSSIWMS